MDCYVWGLGILVLLTFSCVEGGVYSAGRVRQEGASLAHVFDIQSWVRIFFSRKLFILYLVI